MATSSVVPLRITQGEEILPELEGEQTTVLSEPTPYLCRALFLPLIKEELVNGIAHITGGGRNVLVCLQLTWLLRLRKTRFQFSPISQSSLRNTVKSNIKEMV